MTVVNHATGEIVETTALAVADTSSGVAITGYLQQARDWLATAVEETGPEQIAMAKAEIATAAEATKQLGLSKEIQLDAREMVRRAEYALGKAIRKGQEEGLVARRGQGATARPPHANQDRHDKDMLLPSQLASKSELHGVNGGEGIYGMSDGVEPDEFDAAIEEAKAERNLSRANLIRKIKGQKSGETRDDRARKIAELANEGHSSRQIAKKLGMSDGGLARIVRDYGISVPADRVVKGSRRLNSNRILSGTAESLEVAVLGLQQINPQELDPESAQEWIDSLTESLTALRKALNSIKESFHD